MNKKKIITTASAVALAAMMAFGGTMAYYQGQAQESVANTWVDQGNSVSISESDVDGNGSTQSNTYSIIPGTTDKKDPVVTAEYTLDSYVYVTVDDTTGELIKWDTADAWTLVDGYTDVYYLLLKTVEYDSNTWTDYSYTDSETNLTYSYDSTSGTYTVTDNSGDTLYTYTVATNSNGIDVYTASIPIIDGNTVTYSSEITNDTFDGYGTTVALTFDAYIIQASLSDGTDEDNEYGEKEYTKPEDAYYYVNPKDYYETAVENGGVAAIGGTVYETLSNALDTATDGETVTLLTNIAETGAVTYSDSSKSVTLDLNGYTVSNSGSEAYVLSVSGGTLTIADSAGNGAITGSDAQVGVQMTGGVVNLTGGTVSGYAGILTAGGTLNISGGTVKGLSESYATVPTTYDGQSVEVYKDTVDSLTAVNGSGIFIVAGSDSPLTVNISGGTISTASYENNHDICVVKLTSGTSLGVEINVTGGTFGGDSGNFDNCYLAYDWENDEEYSWINLNTGNYPFGSTAGKYKISGGTGLAAGWIGVAGATLY